MKARVMTRVTIVAPPAAVFQYLAHLKYHHLWNPHIRHLSMTEPLQLGMQYRVTSHVLGVTLESTNIVTKFAPPEEFEVENKSGTVHYRAGYQLREHNGQTIVTCTTDLTAVSSAFAFTAPILKRLARRELQTDMQALKKAVELQLE